MAAGGAALTQAATIIDGTTGSNTDSTAYSTDGNLDLSLGFVAEYLIVGGGGGGGKDIGGGGGAGQFIESSVNTVTAQSYTVTVGNGGAGGSTFGENGADGGDSSVFSITAVGGGGGGGLQKNGRSGGSGGGGGGDNGGAGGSGTAGNDGGDGGGGGAEAVGGGGGGAGGVGENGVNKTGGNGGAGLSSSITGASVEYAGGGGGGANNDQDARSNGPGSGSARGGNGGFDNAATNGAANSGSGGGGGGNGGEAGGDGGSGIVVVRYTGAQIASVGGTQTSFTGNGTIGESGVLYQVSTFTSSGAFDLSGVDMNTRLGATLTSGITGTGNLTFSGPGTLTLSGANTYSGSTTVTGGTLKIGASGSITASTSVTINTGATLAGVGTIAGSTSIAGTHSPGSSPGVQTFSSDLTYATGANVDWELVANSQGTAGTDYDQIAVGGNLDFAGTTTLDLIFNASGSRVDWSDAFWQSNQAWLVWDLSTGTTSNFGNLSITSATWLDAQGDSFATVLPNASFTLSQVGEDVSLVYSVPEPSSLLLLAAAAVPAGAAALRRRRRTGEMRDGAGR